MSLNIFWFLPCGGGDGRYLGSSEVTRKSTNEYLRQIATTAEFLGYDGLLIPTASGNLDPIITAATLATATSKIKLLVAVRHTATGGPVVFARQTATLDDALKGRLLLNIVPAGRPDERARDGNFQTHDETYQSADEFYDVWKRVLQGETVDFDGKFYKIKDGKAIVPSVQKPYPPLYFGGSSPAAHEFAAKHAETYLSWGEPVEQLKEKFDDIRKRATKLGRDVKFGVRFQVIVRETEEEAWEVANKLISHLDDDVIKKAQESQKNSGSTGQARINALHNGDKNNLVIAPNLWAGVALVRSGGGIALVGNPEQVAQRIKEFVEIGVETFIFSGYPQLEESIYFAELVFPLLEKESIFVKDDVVVGGGFEAGTVFAKDR